MGYNEGKIISRYCTFKEIVSLFCQSVDVPIIFQDTYKVLYD